MEDYDKNKESSYFNYWDINMLYGLKMLQKLPVGSFKWVKYTSQFNKDFIENYNEDSDEGYFLEVDVEISEQLLDFQNDLCFLTKRRNIFNTFIMAMLRIFIVVFLLIIR